MLFQAAVGVIFGQMADQVPKEFIDDRSKLMGTGQRFDTNAMKAAVPLLKESLRAQLDWLDVAARRRPRVPDRREARPRRLHELPPDLVPRELLPARGRDPRARTRALNAWKERVRAIGHGKMAPMERAEALEIARAAKPETEPAV